GTLVSAAQKAGAKGIVWAGTGNGNLSAPALKATQKARKKGVIIVRAARTGSGFVSRHMELDDDALKFVASGYLNAQKARVALILALSTTHDWKKIQAIYDGINKR
ncbi:L-asparaginase, partial [Myxococcota bacterium]|nr:L-asparaginase [Myxococcota bacterium]